MIIRFRVRENIPQPARVAVQCVQAALGISRHAALQLIHAGAVTVRGRMIPQSHHRLAVGDELVIDYAPQPAAKPQPKTSRGRPRFEIVHDDEHLMVVLKPAGLLTVPAGRRESNSLRTQIDKWLSRRQPGCKAICVHRLDRGVSGLLVFAKSENTAAQLRAQFAARKPRRKYVALVHGELSSDRGTFRSYLATDERTLNCYSTPNAEDGQLAITHFQVQERLSQASLVEVRLETGRKNQIRVHFAEAGHPVLGDSRYSRQVPPHSNWPHKRLALHAEQLGFEHPITHERITFTAPWPAEFRVFRRQSRG